MVRQDSKRSCWTSPKGHHNRWSLMAVVANQAVAFDKSMLTACPHRGDVLRPGLILDHALYRPISAGVQPRLRLFASATIFVSRLESRSRQVRSVLFGSVRRNISST